MYSFQTTLKVLQFKPKSKHELISPQFPTLLVTFSAYYRTGTLNLSPNSLSGNSQFETNMHSCATKQISQVKPFVCNDNPTNKKRQHLMILLWPYCFDFYYQTSPKSRWIFFLAINILQNEAISPKLKHNIFELTTYKQTRNSLIPLSCLSLKVFSHIHSFHSIHKNATLVERSIHDLSFSSINWITLLGANFFLIQPFIWWTPKMLT